MQVAPNIPNWTRVYAGKVHDLYQPVNTFAHSGGDTMMLVASDRIAVLDRVLPTAIPGKGRILTRIARWWFEQLDDVVANHYLSSDVPEVVADRAMVVRRLRMYPFECSVVGYVTGAVFEEYSEAGTIGGQPQPKGLALGDPLGEALFVPSMKGKAGSDDEVISFEQMGNVMGYNQADCLRDISLELYRRAQEIAQSKGLIIAECKLEFGASYDSGDDQFVLADQAFTPDSATFWRESELAEGNPRTFGKDYVRDVVQGEAQEWARGRGGAPLLPPEVVAEMDSRYRAVESTLLD